MKAALLEAIGQINIVETKAPELRNPSDVLVEIGAVGICGSEVHAFKGSHPFRKPPSVMGHEVAGRILEVGSGVTGFTAGERVCIYPFRTCGNCKWCISGEFQQCAERLVLGVPAWPGGFGEVIAAPQSGLHRLPDHVSFVEGTLVETLAVGVHAVERGRVKTGDSVAVIGMGPIGLAIAASSRVAGAETVIAVDVQQHCLDVATNQLGATHGVLASNTERATATAIKTMTNGEGADIVFMAIGLPHLMEEALAAVGRNGRIVLVAFFDGPLTIDAFGIINPEITISGSTGYSAPNYKKALDLISSGKVRANAIVSHILPLTEINRGFELADSKSDKAIKVVLEM